MLTRTTNLCLEVEESKYCTHGTLLYGNFKLISEKEVKFPNCGNAGNNLIETKDVQVNLQFQLQDTTSLYIYVER
jgi:hypothetical protein